MGGHAFVGNQLAVLLVGMLKLITSSHLVGTESF